MTYVPANFEITMSSGLGGNALIQEKTLYDFCQPLFDHNEHNHWVDHVLTMVDGQVLIMVDHGLTMIK